MSNRPPVSRLTLTEAGDDLTRREAAHRNGTVPALISPAGRGLEERDPAGEAIRTTPAIEPAEAADHARARAGRGSAMNCSSPV